jgi:hypothetical protein
LALNHGLSFFYQHCFQSKHRIVFVELCGQWKKEREREKKERESEKKKKEAAAAAAALSSVSSKSRQHFLG